jgi:hypothetical protein
MVKHFKLFHGDAKSPLRPKDLAGAVVLPGGRMAGVSGAATSLMD